MIRPACYRYTPARNGTPADSPSAISITPHHHPTFVQLEAELASTRLELAHATQELNRLHTAMVRRARAEAELLPSTNTGNYWRPTRRS